mmetsp:Transcript_451/g.1712  ORF Transcript_451/g.1712 Transcript_451/m.1712 type:complete len:121 (-) Transcript_451:4958-5320(-)
MTVWEYKRFMSSQMLRTCVFDNQRFFPECSGFEEQLFSKLLQMNCRPCKKLNPIGARLFSCRALPSRNMPYHPARVFSTGSNWHLSQEQQSQRDLWQASTVHSMCHPSLTISQQRSILSP